MSIFLRQIAGKSRKCLSKPLLTLWQEALDRCCRRGAIRPLLRTTWAILRNELGKYLEGTRADMPFLVQSKLFDFGTYNFDFAPDPARSNPTFSFNGSSWTTVDFEQNFDIATGLGFQSGQMGMDNFIQPGKKIFHCQNTGSGDTVQRTVCFNDFNQNDQFHLSLFPGSYQVSVGVGWPGSTRNGDIEYVEVNDVNSAKFFIAPRRLERALVSASTLRL